MAEKSATYLADHSEPVLRGHSTRTVKNSAAYLLKSGAIKPDSRILDIGCGPGSITADFAALSPQGYVVGIEPESSVLDTARGIASQRGLTNIEFKVGNIHALDFPDASFDIVHVHQVLGHVGNPVGALREMRRVTKPGGIVAAREGDLGTWVHYPDPDGSIEKWINLYTRLAALKGGEPFSGRHLLSWCLQAGFKREQVTSSASVWCYNTPEERTWSSGVFADRILTSFKKHAMDSGLATEDDLVKYAASLRQWGEQEDGWTAITSGEVLCHV